MSEVFMYFTIKDAMYSVSKKRCMYQSRKLSHMYKEKIKSFLVSLYLQSFM